MSDVARARVGEYEEIYDLKDDNPQEEKGLLNETIKEYLARGRVLEVACGIGYWTKILSEMVVLIVTKEIGEDMIEVEVEKV